MHIRPFELALIGIFAIAGLAGVFFVRTYVAEPPDPFNGTVVVWGTFDQRTVGSFFNELAKEDEAFKNVSYKEVDVRSFDTDLVNAIAEGRSPDLIIMPHSLIVSYRAKLQSIPFTVIPERTFRDTYIDGAEIFMQSDGIYGIPFAVDPLVMYWNRDIFSSSGLATPPKTWETIVSETTEAIVRKNDRLEITQSAIAFGEYGNVAHAKDILAMLFLQSGSNIVDGQSGAYRITINEGASNELTAGDAVLSFYTQFAIPGKDLYSWNRSKSLDRKEFLNGTLALYFGKGSERKALERENPNLNFDMASVPQGSGATVLRGYGDFYAFAIPRASKNAQGAYAAAQFMGRADHAKNFASLFEFAPAARASYEKTTADPYEKIIYSSALIARGWLDPSPRQSDAIFKKAIEDVTSGKSRLKNVIIDTVQELERLF